MNSTKKVSLGVNFPINKELTIPKETSPCHPTQPLIQDSKGILRFKENAIVRFLLDQGPYNLNDLGIIPFSNEDREQFAQLIGYSVSGFADLDYVSDETFDRATKK